LVVTRIAHHTFQVAAGVQAVLAQDDPGETTRGGVGGVDRQAAPAKIHHGCHIGTAEKPEQRTMGVDAEHFPADAVGQPRQQRAAQTDRRGAAQTLGFPVDPVADGNVDTFSLVVALLVGHVGDQFLVDTTPHVGQVDRVHGQTPFPKSGDFRSGSTGFQSMARPPLTGR
jgi:hypothetical protein